jgi:hypothetical protein
VVEHFIGPVNSASDIVHLTLPGKKFREVIQPATSAHRIKPIRAERRAGLIRSIARGRRWLDEIVSGTTSIDDLAGRHNCSARQINMTLSMAFLAPSLVKAAIEGRLPRGLGIAELRDAPAEWSQLKLLRRWQLQFLSLTANDPGKRPAYIDNRLVRLKSENTDEASACLDGQSLSIPWRKPPSKRSRQIFLPHNASRSDVRPQQFERPGPPGRRHCARSSVAG